MEQKYWHRGINQNPSLEPTSVLECVHQEKVPKKNPNNNQCLYLSLYGNKEDLLVPYLIHPPAFFFLPEGGQQDILRYPYSVFKNLEN